jgi:hypothetical protein
LRSVRLLPLVLCAGLLEVGWLALWPLAITLSHSALFTSAMLEGHPPPARLLTLADRILPGLSSQPLDASLGSAAYTEPATSLAAVLLWLVAIYGLALLLFDRGFGPRRAGIGLIVLGALVFQATLMLLPGWFSQDVFSYIAYGRLAAMYNLNPYIWPPSVLRDPVVPWVAEVWRSYASPYGPLWVDVQWLLAQAGSALTIADQALMYRLLSNVLLLANLALAWRLLVRVTPLSPAQRSTALAALAWNPLVLFELAGNAHNDVLMITFTFLGLLQFTHSSRGIPSSAALTLGTLVKYLSGLGLVWLALASAARAVDWTRRIVRLAAIGIVVLVLSLICVAPWLELPDSLDPLLKETTAVGYVNSLPDALVLMLNQRLGGSVDVARSIERLVMLCCFVAYLAWEARRVWADPSRAGVARALARSSLIYVLLVSTSVQTWYFCLPLSIAFTLGWRRRVTRLALGYSSLALPVLYLSYYLRDTTPGWVYLAYGFVPLSVLVPDLFVLRARARTHVPATEVVGDDKQRPRRHRGRGAVMEEARR